MLIPTVDDFYKVDCPQFDDRLIVFNQRALITSCVMSDYESLKKRKKIVLRWRQVGFLSFYVPHWQFQL